MYYLSSIIAPFFSLFLFNIFIAIYDQKIVEIFELGYFSKSKPLPHFPPLPTELTTTLRHPLLLPLRVPLSHSHFVSPLNCSSPRRQEEEFLKLFRLIFSICYYLNTCPASISNIQNANVFPINGRNKPLQLMKKKSKRGKQ